MSRPKLEVADVFRRFGADWRAANEAHINLAQRRVMTAIEICRTAALGGHVERCQDCAHTRIAYNSCRNRHCPKCQGASAREWRSASPNASASYCFGRKSWSGNIDSLGSWMTTGVCSAA